MTMRGGEKGMKRTRRLTVLAMACVVLMTVSAASPVSASARELALHSLTTSFTAPYGEKLTGVAVDEATGYVYLANSATGSPLEKYNANGVPVAFTAPEASGSSTLTNNSTGGFNMPVAVEVDNSGGSTQGRIYVVSEKVVAYSASGKQLGGNFPMTQWGCQADVAVEPDTGYFWVLSVCQGGTLGVLRRYTPEAVPTGEEKSFEVQGFGGIHRLVIDSQDNLWVTGVGALYRFDKDMHLVFSGFSATDVALDWTTDDAYVALDDSIRQYGVGGSPLAEFGNSPGGGWKSVAVNAATGRIYRGGGGKVEIYDSGATIVLPDVSTGSASDFQATSVNVHGVVDPDGVATSDCYFEWGTSVFYGQKTSCQEGAVLTGSGDQAVNASLENLSKGETYHYRVVAVNGQGKMQGLDRTFTPSALPSIGDEHVFDVHSDSAVLRAQLNPQGAASTYHFEYGLGSCDVTTCLSTPEESLPLGTSPLERQVKVTGLESGATYHYRVIADNQTGASAGSDHVFTTFPLTRVLEDPCPNAHVRQQTSAVLLLDCRAYELVSAANASGYDVESDLVPGQTPFNGYPRAVSPAKVLYAVHDGAISDAGSPTNRGLDTYVATRGDESWGTRYVGIPSDNPFSVGPFASSLLEADPGLESFAFGGSEICAPCFADGSTNIPLRVRGGDLGQGMVGSQSPVVAEPAGYVAQHFSANGSHFIFGTNTQLEPSGNENGDVTIYDRDLDGGTTQVVSTLPVSGDTMTGEVGELAVSADGSRVIVATKVSTDAAGNTFWHPYMHIGTSPISVDLAPGTTNGVLFAGMSPDGTKAFFASKDKLAGGETDDSVDLFQATVGPGGPATLTLLSGGATPPTGDSDACDPAANADGNNWNAVGGSSPNSCGVVPLAGGGGVADDGTVYFFSPEALDGSGTPNQANLFVVRPNGAPTLVATLEPDHPAVRDGVKDNEIHRYGDFQVSPGGQYAAFASRLSLTGYDSDGQYAVFRYGPHAASLVCVSCNPTNARAVGDSTLPQVGLGLDGSGRVFFDSGDAMAPRDLDEKQDAYEYSNGELRLISTGESPFDSRLLGVSVDGVDAYFFTRDTLVPQDENGDLVKIYDARAGGGFEYISPPPQCRASDECHGPGTEAAPAPEIRTIRGTDGNHVLPTSKRGCKRGKVRKAGRCVRKKARHRRVRRQQSQDTRGRG